MGTKKIILAKKGWNTEANLKSWLELARPYGRIYWRYLFFPAIIYFAIFFVVQPHYLSAFSDGFYLDKGDGMQNVWNIWWVNESIVDNQDSPYFTNVLQWPHGTTLIPQTLNIFNGLVSIPLIHLFGLSLVQATNIMVIFSFVFSGITMMWLIYKLYKNYFVAFIAGGLYTFSTYHFAHAQGHLQLVSFEFIPLFILSYILLMQKVRYRYAILASLSLFLVLLCDYYYLFWSVIVAGLYAIWKLYKKELPINGRSIRVFSLFVLMSAVLVGPLVYRLISISKSDPFLGYQDRVNFNLDPLSIFIPGGSWKWSSLTEDHWSKLNFASETSVYFGSGLLLVLAFLFVRLLLRKKYAGQPNFLNFWWMIMFLFAILALGKHLSVYGRTLDSIPLPYAFLEKIFPTLQISGLPVRWVFISLFSAIIIASYGLTRINMKRKAGILLMAGFLCLSVLDLYPKQLPLTYNAPEKYVTVLRDLPSGGVIDNAAESGGVQLYNQTIHEKPMAFGYVTRLPKSVNEKNFLIFAALEEGRHAELCSKYRIRYVTTPVYRPLKTTFPPIYQDQEAIIYDMSNSNYCAL